MARLPACVLVLAPVASLRRLAPTARTLATGAVLACMVVAALASLPAALAQAHEHGDSSGIVVGHDVPASGRVYVGDVAHFDILDLGADLSPDPHQQNHVRVSENGVVLMETTVDSGHDYDGVYTLDIVFPVTGNYTVEALDAMGMPLASFHGFVVAGPRLDPGQGAVVEAKPVVTAPSSASLGVPAVWTIDPLDAHGARLNHTDSLVELRQAGQVLLRTHLHTHNQRQSFSYAFTRPGQVDYQVTTYVSYPSPKAILFVPVVTSGTLTVGPAPDAAPTTNPDAIPTTAPVAANPVIVGTSTSDEYTLVGTYDPYDVVAAGMPQRLSVLVMDPATHAPLPHVDFAAHLVGPTGVAFDSATLHEYDGIYELLATQAIPGQYTLVAQASYDAWSGHIEMPYTVTAPVMPVVLGIPPTPASGLEILDVTGFQGMKAGEPTTLTFALHDAAGVPFPHSEIDVAIRNLDAQAGAGPAPLLATKLHTHDGSFQLTLNVPAPGSYRLDVAPLALDGQPVVFRNAQLGADLATTIDVADGPGIPAVPVDEASVPSAPVAQVAPGLGAVPTLTALAALAGLGAAMTRRK